MNEKRFELDDDDEYLIDNKTGKLYDACGGGDGFPFIIKEYHKLQEENEQLKQRIKIFEKFLEGNDLDIEWDEFCGVDECAFENPDFSCKECIHLKGDVE